MSDTTLNESGLIAQLAARDVEIVALREELEASS